MPESRIKTSVQRSLEGHGRIVLAVSGGIDSMVLLHAAAAVLPAERLVVATFDHGTGTHATHAARFVTRRAAALGVECVRDRARFALGSEAELRTARWSFLDGVATSRHAVVCTAHTADDHIETVFMRVLRGAGARGLAALLADSPVRRPLLAVTRADIVRYARREGVEWIEDPSNASLRFFRNRVRHQLLPAVRRVRPSIDADLLAISTRAAEWRSEVDEFVERAVCIRAREDRAGLDIEIASLSNLCAEALAFVLPAVVARSGVVLDRRGLVRLTQFASTAKIGRRMQLSGGWEVVRSRDALQLRASSETKPTSSPLALSYRTTWSAFSFEPAKPDAAMTPWTAVLPTDRPLSIRAWRPGDVMRHPPSGRVRKVKHLLSEAGVTGHERGTWPVVLAGDEIIWIPGVRRSDATADPTGRSGLSFTCEHVNR